MAARILPPRAGRPGRKKPPLVDSRRAHNSCLIRDDTTHKAGHCERRAQGVHFCIAFAQTANPGRTRARLSKLHQLCAKRGVHFQAALSPICYRRQTVAALRTQIRSPCMCSRNPAASLESRPRFARGSRACAAPDSPSHGQAKTQTRCYRECAPQLCKKGGALSNRAISYPVKEVRIEVGTGILKTWERTSSQRSAQRFARAA
jgi:hypothetical protein